MMDTAGEVSIYSLATFSFGILHMDTPELANLQKTTLISYLWILGAV